MRTGLITLAHGRHGHLARQAAAVASSTCRPDSYVVVAMGDPHVAGLVPGAAVVDVPLVGQALPLAAARNVGARTAVELGAELLVFLDVDCLPSPELLRRYATAARTHDGVLMGPVGYLPPPGPQGYSPRDLHALAVPNAARPVPADGDVERAEDPNLFWSLSFAMSASTWQRIGGFCEDYIGYGAEDTDFGWTVHRAGVPLWSVGGAWAYHQHHGQSGATRDHLDDILRNGEVFHRRWGRWPMTGWFEDFEDRGLVRRSGDGWVLA